MQLEIDERILVLFRHVLDVECAIRELIQLYDLPILLLKLHLELLLLKLLIIHLDMPDVWFTLLGRPWSILVFADLHIVVRDPVLLFTFAVEQVGGLHEQGHGGVLLAVVPLLD